MGKPIWLEVLAMVAPLLFFFFGRASKGGENQNKLDRVSTDVNSIQAREFETSKQVAQHQTMHDGYREFFAEVRKDMKQLSVDVSHIRGGMDSLAQGRRD